MRDFIEKLETERFEIGEKRDYLHGLLQDLSPIMPHEKLSMLTRQKKAVDDYYYALDDLIREARKQQTKPRRWDIPPQPEDVLRVKDAIGRVWEKGEFKWVNVEDRGFGLTWETLIVTARPLTEVDESEDDR